MVAVAVQLGEHPVMRRAVCLVELGQGGVGAGVELQFGALAVDGAAHAVTHDLGVPRGAELPGQPLELVAQRADRRRARTAA